MENNFRYDHKVHELIPMGTAFIGVSVASDVAVQISKCMRPAILLNLLAASVPTGVAQVIKIAATKADKTVVKNVNFSITKLGKDGTKGETFEVLAADGYSIAGSVLTNGTHQFLIEVRPIDFNNNDDFVIDSTYIKLLKTAASAAAGTISAQASVVEYGLFYN